MKFLIQRVTEASVSVDQQIIGKIGKGFLVFIGVCETDTEEIADKMVKKLLGLRIFEDENGKTNLDLHAVLGSLLLISQFTLYADCRKGNRPSFIKAGSPDQANELYEYIIELCRKELSDKSDQESSDNLQLNAHDSSRVQTGRFGADMKIQLLNDGPFTIMLDSEELGIH